MLLLLGFFMWPKLKGAHNVEKAKQVRAIMIFNHASYLDALIVGTLFTPCGLAKVRHLPPPVPFFLLWREILLSPDKGATSS